MLYGHTEIMPPKFICDSYGGAYGEAPSGQPASLSALLIMTNWFILTHQASDCRINYIIYNYGFTNLYSDCILPPPQNCAYSYGTWITNSMAWFVTLPCGSVCSIKKMIHTKECLHIFQHCSYRHAIYRGDLSGRGARLFLCPSAKINQEIN